MPPPVQSAAFSAQPTPLGARLARLRAGVWRFKTLSFGERVFGGATAPCVLRRPLFGYRIAVDVARSNTHRLLFLEGARFLGERALVRSLLAPDMAAVDVGANIGYYLMLIESVVGTAGSVVCFEPDSSNLGELRRNVLDNHLSNVKVVAAAVGATDGAAALLSGINAAIAKDGEGDCEVPLVRLDAVLTGRVDFLKIDVEGYEGEVLSGAHRILAEERPALFLEVHPGFLTAPHTVDGILGLLSAAGYPAPEIYELTPQEDLGSKLAARYLRRGVRPAPQRESLLADCRAGRRAQPFWAVCRSGKHRAEPRRPR
jgi:FkbM family methyltransferase